MKQLRIDRKNEHGEELRTWLSFEKVNKNYSRNTKVLFLQLALTDVRNKVFKLKIEEMSYAAATMSYTATGTMSF